MTELLLDGSAMQKVSKDKFGVEPMPLGSQQISADIKQIAYMIPSRDFILITMNSRTGSGAPFTLRIN